MRQDIVGIEDIQKRALAAHRKAWKKEYGKFKWSAGTIAMVGMYSDDVHNVTLDGKHRLYQLHPTYELALLTPRGADKPSFSKVVFFSNCLAYLHDAPVFAWPGKPNRRCWVSPIDAGKHAKPDAYWQNLLSAFELVHCTKYAWYSYHFRWPGYEAPVDLPLTLRYGRADREIALYATAARQLDPLAEFLSYYRVIESVDTGNGKSWLSANLSRIADFDFGMLDMTDQELQSVPYQRNAFNAYRRRAAARLRVLSRRLGVVQIPRYLYNEVRCGVSHGRHDTKVFDFDSVAAEITKDIPILKLAARIAVEDKANKSGIPLPTQPRPPRRDPTPHPYRRA